MANYILADNQDLTCFAFDSLLRRQGDAQLMRATNKSELVERLKERERSIVLLDYTLFDFPDAESLLIVGERFSETTWILVSEDLTEQFLRKVIYSSHRFSVVFKDSSLKVVREALLYAARGDRYICQRAADILLRSQLREEEAPAQLTATEIEIVRGIAQGKTTKEIAAERFSSIHTINTHRKNIFRKLGVNTAHEAIKYAFRAGLVETSEFYI